MKHIFELPVLVAILALAWPSIGQAQQSEFAAFDGHAVEAVDQLQDLFENDDAATQIELAYEVDTAIDPLAFVIQKNLIEDTDDLVSRPYNYQGRPLVVAGSVVQFLWEYRLKSRSGQEIIVIDVDSLNQSDRVNLDAALDRAGIFGRVRARIHGRIERATSTTFELAATQLVLIDPTDPTETLVPTESSRRRRESGDRDIVISNGETAGGGDAGGGDAGGGDAGGGDAGGGDAGGGDSGGGDSGGGDSGGGDSGGGDSGGGDSGGGDSGGGDSGGGDSGGGDSGGGDSGGGDSGGGDSGGGDSGGGDSGGGNGRGGGKGKGKK